MAVITLGTDFHQWAETTAEAIRDKRFGDVDWEQVAEEIDSLGKSEVSELSSRLAQLMYHLLKAQYQPERHSKRWERTIRDHSAKIQDNVVEQFPEDCPYSLDVLK